VYRDVANVTSMTKGRRMDGVVRRCRGVNGARYGAE
jgi:hypothetical protein